MSWADRPGFFSVPELCEARPFYNASVPLLRNLRVTLEMIKWEHSVFALPFALCGAVLAARGVPTGRQLLWIVVAMVAAWELNRLSFLLSPVALAILLIYSYTKRWTRWSHLVLGFALGIAPAAAWIAIRGSLDPRILLLTAAVTFWVAGFDVLYACQDIDFDLQAGLHSIPRYCGIGNALWIARLLHLSMLFLLAGLVWVFGLGTLAILGVVAVLALLAYEHSLVSEQDLGKLNAAFFTMNGIIAVVFFVFLAADLLLRT